MQPIHQPAQKAAKLSYIETFTPKNTYPFFC